MGRDLAPKSHLFSYFLGPLLNVFGFSSQEAVVEMECGTKGIFLQMNNCGTEGQEARLGRETEKLVQVHKGESGSTLTMSSGAGMAHLSCSTLG